MADNVHPVVDLMLARMESHPHEFDDPYGGRWHGTLEGIKEYATDEEAEAVRLKRNQIIMDKVHEHALDELCNGEERRRKEQEEREAEKQRMLAQAAQSTSLLGLTGAGQSTPLQDALGYHKQQLLQQLKMEAMEAYKTIKEQKVASDAAIKPIGGLK